MGLSELFFGKTRTLEREKTLLDKEMAELSLEKSVILKRHDRDKLKNEIIELSQNGHGSTERTDWSEGRSHVPSYRDSDSDQQGKRVYRRDHSSKGKAPRKRPVSSR